MRVSIAAAGTQTGAATIRAIIRSNPTTEIHALYRNLEKVPEEFKTHPKFGAVKGDIEDAASLDFAGSNAVLAMTPPIFQDIDVLAHTRDVCNNIKQAIEKAGTVKRLVLLSSTGAEFDKGVGEILTNNIAETILTTASVPEILFVRCGYFMENWTMMVDTLRGQSPFFASTITPLDYKVPMIAVRDIGTNLAMGLTSGYTPPVKPYVFELHGPEDYCPLDVQSAFTKALGKDVDIKSVEKKDLPAFFGAFCPPQVAALWAEMTESFLPGGIAAVDSPQREKVHIVRGKTVLDEAIKDEINQKLWFKKT